MKVNNSNNETVSHFQNKVSKLLLRHRSILDSLSKHVESTTRINRAISKTVTDCGCISVNAEKQQIPPETSLSECHKYLDSHIKGNLCENCKETVEEEIGNNLFYLAALCHLLDIELEEIIGKEYERLNALGLFHLS